jgi:hypothetical protein
MGCFQLQLSSDHQKLLLDIIARRDKALASVLRAEGTLQRENIERLTETVAAELVDRGLDVNDEPTSYGLQIESLIDALNRHGFR